MISFNSFTVQLQTTLKCVLFNTTPKSQMLISSQPPLWFLELSSIFNSFSYLSGDENNSLFYQGRAEARLSKYQRYPLALDFHFGVMRILVYLEYFSCALDNNILLPQRENTDELKSSKLSIQYSPITTAFPYVVPFCWNPSIHCPRHLNIIFLDCQSHTTGVLIFLLLILL